MGSPRSSGSEGSLPQRSERLSLPFDDVRERVLAQPALADDPRACAETGHWLFKTLRTEPVHDAIERLELGLDAGDGRPLGVRNGRCGHRVMLPIESSR